MSKVLFLYNLANRVSMEELKKTFSAFGNIRKVNIKKGIGFIEFQNPEAATRAADSSPLQTKENNPVYSEIVIRGVIHRHKKWAGSFSITWRQPNEENYFTFELLKNHSVSRLHDGDVVEFELIADEKGNDQYKARIIRMLLKHTDYEKTFINPYNFVRVEKANPQERKPFSHDHTRYHRECYSGKLHCRMTTISPLFIPDTETKTRDKEIEDHWHYGFFRDNQSRPLIPATSLKGMVRNVFETLSNSCFSQVNKKNEKINFRGPKVKDLKPAIVLKLPDEDGNGKVLICRDAWVDRYFFYDRNRKQFPRVIEKAKIELVDYKLPNGASLRFNIETLNHKGKNSFPFSHVLDLGKGTMRGFLKITGMKKSSNKHDERVFYHDIFKRQEFENINKSKEAASILLKPGIFEHINDDVLEFTFDEKFRYESVVHTQINTGVAHIKRKNEYYKDGTVYYGKNLAVGELIYVVCKGKIVENLSYVSIPKRTFRENVYSLLEAYSTSLLPCKTIEHLCPACNVFGAAKLSRQEEIASGRRKNVSLAGKINITNGRIKKGRDCEFDWVTLKILGEPHETATNFYLIDSNYENKIAIDKKERNGYDFRDNDTFPILRGRKYYWHQCDNKHPLPLDRYALTNSRPGYRSNQNSTVEVLKEGAEFEFDVYFENLSKDELAVLIYTLELEPGMYHRLGHAKPLGLGTVEIKIDPGKTRILDFKAIRESYLEIAAPANKSNTGKWIEFFRDHFPQVKVAGKPITQTMNYRDLKHMLTPHPELFAKIGYPAAVLLTGQHTGESYGFGWFSRFANESLATIGEVLSGEEQNHFSDQITGVLWER